MTVTPLTKVSAGFLLAAALQLAGGVWWLSALSSQVKDNANDIADFGRWKDRNGERLVIDVAKLQQTVIDLKELHAK